jgi:hypothetical protein
LNPRPSSSRRDGSMGDAFDRAYKGGDIEAASKQLELALVLD